MVYDPIDFGVKVAPREPPPEGAQPLDFLEQKYQEVLERRREKHLAEEGLFKRALHRGVESSLGSLAAFAGLFGSLSKIPSLRDWGYLKFQELQEQASTYPGTELEDITSASLFAKPFVAVTWGVEKVIENAPFLVSVMGSGGIAGLMSGGTRLMGSRVAGKAAENLIKKQALRAVPRKIADKVAKGQALDEAEKVLFSKAQDAALKTFAAKAAVVATTTPYEAGGMYGEAMARGIDNPISALALGTAAGFVELAGGNIRIIDRVFGKQSASTLTAGVNRAKKALRMGKSPTTKDVRLISRIFSEASIQAPQEFVQETVQELLALANIGINDPTFQVFSSENIGRLAESGFAGLAVGSILGGASAPLGGRYNLVQRKAMTLTDRELESAINETNESMALEPDDRDLQGIQETLENEARIRMDRDAVPTVREAVKIVAGEKERLEEEAEKEAAAVSEAEEYEATVEEIPTGEKPFEPGQEISGIVYRAETGFKAEGTAADVVAFEVEEHGNVDIGEMAAKTGIDLSKYPASDIVWVTKTAKDAERYGEPEEYTLPKGSQIIAEDGEGGYLVLTPTEAEEAVPAEEGLVPIPEELKPEKPVSALAVEEAHKAEEKAEPTEIEKRFAKALEEEERLEAEAKRVSVTEEERDELAARRQALVETKESIEKLKEELPETETWEEDAKVQEDIEKLEAQRDFLRSRIQDIEQHALALEEKPAEEEIAAGKYKKELERTGTARKGDTTVKIIQHLSGKGFAVETTIAGNRILPTEEPMSLDEARGLAIKKLEERPIEATPEPEIEELTAEKRAIVSAHVGEQKSYEDVLLLYPGSSEVALFAQERGREKFGIAPAEEEAPAEEGVVPAEEEAAFTPQRNIAETISGILHGTETVTWKRLFEIADEQFGGTQAEGKYNVKEAYDAMELGLNLYLNEGIFDNVLTDVNSEFVIGFIRELKGYLKRLPTQTKRTEETLTRQQFSTPPPLAYVANWVANINEEDVYLEPSAGVGGLAVFGKKVARETIVNEIDERRNAALYALHFDAVHKANAEHLHSTLPAEIKPTVIVMNPPFSATERMKGKKVTGTGAAHVEEALKRLQEGGRLVAILGRGMAMDRPAFAAWWKKIQSEYTVRANVGVSGKEYTKFGTSFANQLIVIDKIGEQGDVEVVQGFVEKVEQLVSLLEGVKNERAAIREQIPREPSGEEVVPEVGEHRPRPTRPVLPEPHVAPSGEPAVEGVPRPGELATTPTRPAAEGGVAGIQERPGRRPGEVAEPTGERPEAGGVGAIGVGAPEVSGVTPEPAPGELDTGRAAAIEQEEVAGKDDVVIFSRYQPTIKVKGAKPHPTLLDESISMAAVSPPVVDYKPRLKKEIIETGALSQAQLESIIHTGAAHEKILPNGERQGYFDGDGPGVGKGRVVAGIIMDNWNRGRKKSVWVSEKWTLINDAERDLKGILWEKPPIFKFNKYKYGISIKEKEGICFITYSTMCKKRKVKEGVEGEEVIREERRIDQLIEWVGEDFDGVLVFDEAHNMQSAIAVQGTFGFKQPTITALEALKLKRKLPKARVVYVSATGASEVKDFAYATRLGMWGEQTSFATAGDFITKIDAGGLAAMEVVARDLKAMGLYCARSITYQGIKQDQIKHNLTDQQRNLYDRLANAWLSVMQGAEGQLTELQYTGMEKGRTRSYLYGAQQRFFNSVLTSMSTPTVIKQLEKDIAAGKAPVLQIVNTDEAQLERALKEIEKEGLSIDDIDTSPRDCIRTFVRKYYPTIQHEEYRDEDGNTQIRVVYDEEGNPAEDPQAVAEREKLLVMINDLPIPDSPLRLMLDHFGADNLAEITGRKRRVFTDPVTKKTINEKRSPSKIKKEADEFNDDKRKLLIFSYAGGTGVSYHADKNFKNQRERVHYGWQMGWITKKAVQGLGRTNRANQKQPPSYNLVTTDVPSHARFIATIQRRLDQLGALTRGLRQAGSQGLFTGQPNIESDYGRGAVRSLFREVGQGLREDITADEVNELLNIRLLDRYGNFIERNLPDIKRFLNRLLMTPLDIQAKFYKAFYEKFDENIENAIAQGTYDQGVETVPVVDYRVISSQNVHIDEKTGAVTQYVQIEADFENEMFTYDQIKKRFYEGLARNKRSGKLWAYSKLRSITDPVTGNIRTVHTLLSTTIKRQLVDKWEFDKNYELIEEEKAEGEWKKELDATDKTHTEELHIISGTLLPIWNRLPTRGGQKVQRIRTEKKSILGRILNKRDVEDTLRSMGADMPSFRKPKTENLAKDILNKNVMARLVNGWTLSRSKVSGENRIELSGVSHYEKELIRNVGLFSEVISYHTRWFVPTGTGAQPIIDRLLKTYPVDEVLTPDQRIDEGNVYSSSTGRRGKGMSANAVQEEISPLTSRFFLPVNVVQGIEDLPEKLKRDAKIVMGKGRIVHEIYDLHNGEAYMIADNIWDRKHALRVMLHVCIGHYGFRNVIGRNYEKFLNELAKSKKYGADIHRIMESEGKSVYLASEEWFAQQVERGIVTPSLWSRFIFYFKKAVRSLGIDMKFGRAELEELIMRSYRAAKLSPRAARISNLSVSPIFNATPIEDDGLKEFKRLAIEANDREIMPHFASLAADENRRRAKAGVDKRVTAKDMYRQILNKKLAIGFSKLSKLAEYGELPDTKDHKYEDLIDALIIQAQETYKEELDDETVATITPDLPDSVKDQLFPYLHFIMDEYMETEAGLAAATIFKGRAEKMRYIKTTLGRNYHHWTEFVTPEYADNQQIVLKDEYLRQVDIALQDANSMGLRLIDKITKITGSNKLPWYRTKYKDEERRLEMAIALYIDLKEAENKKYGTPEEQFEKYKDTFTEEQIDLYGYSQALPEEAVEIAEEIIKLNYQFGIEARKDKILTHVLDNYSMRLWKQDEDRELVAVRRKFGFYTGRAKQRTLESILHGWSEGKELRIKGAVNALVAMRQEIEKVRYARWLRDEMRASGLAINEGKAAPRSWQLLEHPNFIEFVHTGNIKEFGAKAKKKLYGKGIFVTDEGDVYRRVRVYAHPLLAKTINNLFGLSKLYSVPGFQTLTQYTAEIKHTIFTLSSFHHQALLRSFLFGGRYQKGDLNVSQVIQEGERLIRDYGEDVQLLSGGGLTIGKQQEWDELDWVKDDKLKVNEIIDRVAVIAKHRKKVLDLRDNMTYFLFQRMMPALKIMTAIAELEAQRRKHGEKLRTGEMTQHDIALMVANLINDDFGGLHHGRIQKHGRDPTIQHVLRLMLLAPDWCFSGDIRVFCKDGWKYYSEVRIGDEILAFDKKKQTVQWEKIKDIYINNEYDGPMINLHNHGRDIRMTPDHRCYVYNKNMLKYETILASNIKAYHAIPRCALNGYGCPEEKLYSDTFIKLAGWFVTDGYTKTCVNKLADGSEKEYKYGKITQAKPHNIETIKAICTMKYHTEDKIAPGGINKDGKRILGKFIKYVFTIPKHYFEQMQRDGLCDGLNWDFLSKLTRDQLQILYDTMFLGDGTGQRRFCGKEKEVFYMTMLQTMLGLPSTFYQQEKNCWRTRVLNPKNSMLPTNGKRDKVTETTYKGVIWCPSIPSKYFVAEREGLIFITGNTESNVRTMYKAFITGGKAEQRMYKEFWGRVVVKAMMITFAFNIILTAMDDDDIWERYQKAWKAGRFKWLDADVTPLRRIFGMGDGRKKYLSLIGHFHDPFKFICHPVLSLKHKGSPLIKTMLEGITGEDWKGARFTTFPELLGLDKKDIYLTTKPGKYRIGDPKGGKLRGQLTSWDWSSKGAVEWWQLPSYLLHSLAGFMPIPAQSMRAFLAGEMDGWDAILKSTGFMATSGYSGETSKKEIISLYHEYYKRPPSQRPQGELLRINQMRLEYNKRAKEDDELTPIPRSTIRRHIKAIRISQLKKAS